MALRHHSKRTTPAAARALASKFETVPQGPPDPIFSLTDRFREDDNPNKVHLGVGAYRTEEGDPCVLQCVREAEQRILAAEMDHEYSQIGGDATYVGLTLQLLYGPERPALVEGRVAAIQSISGTGALRVSAEFLRRFYPGATVYISNPTWGNHRAIYEAGGCEVKQYRYFDWATNGLDFEGLLEDLRAAQPGSAVVLHACAHNPTGVDPSLEQWREVMEVMREREHICVFDTAYQGFATGDADADAAAVRMFVDAGMPVISCQSYSKNFGLYGQRIGAISVVTDSPAERDAVQSQLKRIARAMYSNPPVNGARIVSTVLGDPELAPLWYEECASMANRIYDMRVELTEALLAAGSKLDWSHVTSQIGMFCFTGLRPHEVEAMIDDHHIYLTADGRISMAGICSGNVEYIARALHMVTATREGSGGESD